MLSERSYFADNLSRNFSAFFNMYRHLFLNGSGPGICTTVMTDLQLMGARPVEILSYEPVNSAQESAVTA